MQIADVQEDIVRVIASRSEIDKVISRVAARTDEDYRNKRPLLITVLKGAMPTAAALMQALHIDVEIDFVRLSSYAGGTTSSGTVSMVQDIATDVTNRHVLIVEDIVDSGRTTGWLVQELRRRGAASVEIFTLLRKSCRRSVEVEIRYYGIDIPDEFVVGFGLDYDERFRNLDSIAVLKPQVYRGA